MGAGVWPYAGVHAASAGWGVAAALTLRAHWSVTERLRKEELLRCQGHHNTGADWAGCLDTRCSTSGYAVFLGGNLVSWSSKRQPVVSRSSAEAEYRAVANGVAEASWLRQLLAELHSPLAKSTLVYCDNVSAVYLSTNPVQHQRTKHGRSTCTSSVTGSPSAMFGFCMSRPPPSLPTSSPRLAMSEELAALDRTRTWDLVPLPSQIVPITSKWVFKIKTKSDGSIERYKARLVARGFRQTQGRDYDDTFAPVAHMATVRTLIAVAAASSWTISQMDVKHAFLHGDLHEEVYMHPPPGVDVPPGYICRLRRALYGLKQASRAWFQRFASVIYVAGFSPSDHDPSLFVHLSSRGRTMLLLYVEDMLITGDDPDHISHVKKQLSEQFQMSNLGPLSYFLGIEVSQTAKGLHTRSLARSALSDHPTAAIPMDLHLKLHPSNGTPLDDPSRYRHIVGSLVYLTVTRPDIAHAVHILTQFVSAPTSVHFGHLLRVLRYLQGTSSQCLFYARDSPLQLHAYSDSTWASDATDRRSVKGYCIFLGSSPIAWKSKKQAHVSHSNAEAELRALATTTSEIIWLRWLLADFGISCHAPTPLLCGNTGAIQIAHDPVKHELTKHIGVDASFTRSHCRQKTIDLQYVPSELQLADFFTKAQTQEHHRLHLIKLNASNPPPSP
ncbi:hypothetical protein U9M48_032583 [Paspalum notatum var. saurae]|uniref:Reverse transcriptase Ty1/copia-type domain-containing protein n=1 Tax=Paspalum notatum var. saurae TaxID=547442 RepID=A0AAQ3U5Y5_PASNO